jgi:hypothetical protein
MMNIKGVYFGQISEFGRFCGYFLTGVGCSLNFEGPLEVKPAGIFGVWRFGAGRTCH